MPGRVSSPRLIGREAELARLRRAVESTAEDRSRLMLVSGDAGVGKSRLVAELVAGLGDGATVLQGSCLALPGGGLPYAPLTEAVRRLARDTDAAALDALLGPARTELARLLPELAVEAPALEPPAGRADQARLFELVLGLLQRLARDRPVVLVLEDLQWADGATRDLVGYLAHNLTGESVTIIATIRSDEPDASDLEPWLAELRRQSGVESLDLGPLSETDVADQLRSIVDVPVAPSAVRSVVTRSGGNALFVEELAAAGAATGRAGSSRLPPTLKGMLRARIRHLGPDAIAVVRALAVAGGELDARLIGPAAGLDEVATDAALHGAIDRHVATIRGDGDRVALRHGLVGEAILDDLVPGERRRLHAAIGAALEARPELGDPSPARAAGALAHHWAAADRPDEAFRWSLAAADAASAVYAHGEAAGQRRRALHLLARLSPGVRATAPSRIELLLAAEDSANLAGELAEAEALVREGLASVDPGLDPTTAGILESRLGYHRWAAGHSEEALAAHRRAVELVPSEPPSLERARVLRGLGGALMGMGRYRESLAVCAAAIDAARSADAPVEEGRALDMLGMDRVGLGDIVGGIEALEAACRLAREHDPVDGLIVGLHNLAYHLIVADQLPDAVATAREGIEVTHGLGLDRRYGANLRAVAADALIRLGRLDEAEPLLDEAGALDRSGEGSLYVLVERIRIATARGRFEEARSALVTADELATGDVDFDLVAYLRAAEAELAAWSGSLDAGTAAVAAGLAALEGRDDPFLTGPLIALGSRLAADRAVDARAWRDDAARQQAEATARQLEARQAALDADRARIDAPTTVGAAAVGDWARAERGRLDDERDPRPWSVLADSWAALGMAPLEAYARLRAAEAGLAGRTSRSTVTAALRTADEIARRTGWVPVADAAAALARRARIRLESADGTGRATTMRPSGGRDARLPTALTDDEIEVLGLLAAGRTDREIATTLGLSPSAVRGRVTRIRRRLGATNRVEAAATAVRLGLVDEPSRAGAAAAGGERSARTFLFTDVVASTALLEAIGDQAWVDLRRWHDETLRGLFAGHGGVEVDHAGDGFFVVFPEPRSAVACAVAIQRALAEHRRTAGFAPAVRVGVHSGTATRVGRAWTGRDVHLAARLMARATGGGIIVSASTARAAGLRPSSVETVELPGIAEPMEVAAISWR